MNRKLPALIACLALVGGLALSTVASASDRLIAAESAKKAPAWTLKDLDGKSVSAADLKGKVVVVDFWATWCGPCVAEIPGYVELQKQYEDKGLVIVGVSVDEAGVAKVKRFAESKKMNYPIVMASDEIISDFGGVTAIPTTFIVDREGRIRFKKTGAMEKDEFETLLKPLL